jgi:hypothetical protein
MTMDLSGNAFLQAYLRSLKDWQLSGLNDWQGERLSDSPSKDTITDALDKKRMIYLEQKRRR